MKTMLVIASASSTMNSIGWYLLGAVISLAILVYLVYTLVKPDKF
jgi:K+-transporting ATPase KdpF subunit